MTTPMRNTSRLTVKALRDALAEFPDDTLVLVDGYEDGWDDAKSPRKVIAYDVQGEAKGSWWSGRYDDKPDEGEEPIKAVVIARGRWPSGVVDDADPPPLTDEEYDRIDGHA